MRALDDMLATITLYYDEAYIRSINGGEAILLEDLSAYFDASKTRIFTDEYGNEYEITLGEELAAHAQDFLGELDTLKPDITDLAQTAGAYIYEGNLVLPESDMAININSPSGAIQADLKDAELKGENMEALAADMQAVAADYMAIGKEVSESPEGRAMIAGTDISRGIYKVRDRHYPKGKIYYSMGDNVLGINIKNIQTEHEEALRDAMNDWEEKVAEAGGRIEFIDKTNDLSHQALAAVGLADLRIMISGWLGSTSGIAVWGANFGRARLTLNNNLSNETVSPYTPHLYRTTRHELGHVLGLYHEHQHWNRDAYLNVPMASFWDCLDWIDGLFNNIKITRNFEIPILILVIRFWEVKTS
jgi:predicted Zn-dependent protease